MTSPSTRCKTRPSSPQSDRFTAASHDLSNAATLISKMNGLGNPPKTQLTGRVLYKGDPGWEEARKNFNARIDYDALEPRVIVFCQNRDDVVNGIRWARENHVPLRVRSGRHNYEGFSVLKDGIVIDVSEMDRVSLNRSEGLATVGPGIGALALSEKLAQVGLAVPVATAASVGLGGLVQGGGFGTLSRKFGLTCDNLVDVEMVTADAKVVHASEKENPDLFWALRGGGGGNFGVVTAFTFKTHPVPLHVQLFTASWDLDNVFHFPQSIPVELPKHRG